MPVMRSQGGEEDEAAIFLGASSWQMFRRVALPNIRSALLYSFILTNASAIGEFQAVSVVSWSIPGEIYTLPLQVELLHYDYIQHRGRVYRHRAADPDGDCDIMLEERAVVAPGAPQAELESGKFQ